MKTISHPLFIIVFSAYVSYYFLKILNIRMPEIITNYLADLLSLFIVNTVILWILRIIKSNKKIELKPEMVIASFLMFSVFFEFYLPSINNYYYLDYLDVLCYLTSALSFLFWRKRRRLVI